jgi:hypothetical protein
VVTREAPAAFLGETQRVASPRKAAKVVLMEDTAFWMVAVAWCSSRNYLA